MNTGRSESNRELVSVILGTSISVPGELVIPERAQSIVLFAHGSGILRSDTIHLSQILHRKNIATVLFDLLTPDEAAFDEKTAVLRTDYVTLGERLVSAVIWLKEHRELRQLSLGIFADDCAASAAVTAAARLPEAVKAIVSRSGVLDFAKASLPYVQCPTLFICGETDESKSGNEIAAAQLRAKNKLIVVPGAGSLLADGPSMEQVGSLAADWFCENLHFEDPKTIPAVLPAY